MPMSVHVLFFGRLKEIVGSAEENAELNEDANVEGLFARYGELHPELSAFRKSVVASVIQVFAAWHAPLGEGDEVAFLPPVSGGISVERIATAKDLFELVRLPIPVAEIVAGMKGPHDGARGGLWGQA